MMESLIIRADASTQIGTGHLMRCLALAQAWKDAGGQVVFITACQSEALLQRLREEGFDIHLLAHPYPDPGDWDYTKDILAAHPDAWVVLDGYHFDELYQQQVKQAGHRLLVIDDMAHLKHYYADIVLNQNLHAEQLHYACEPYTRLLLGTHYVLLRREFLAWRDWKRDIPEVAQRVLVTLGGGDPENHTLKVIQALQEVDIPALEATVVIGPSNPHDDALEAAVGQSRIPIRLIHNATNMPELMAWADVAVSAAGATVWELAWMGVPAVLFIQADNQRKVAEELHQAGAAVSLGWAHRIDTPDLGEKLEEFVRDDERRQMIVQQMKTLVDAQGASRVMMHMIGEKLKLREACDKDCRLLWEWANDPVVRAASFSSNQISWDAHESWFQRKIVEPDCLIYIIMDEHGEPVGQVRFDTDSQGSAEINISIDAKERKKGYGSDALKLACQYALHACNIEKVLAHIKKDNKASIRAFIRAGFIDKGLEDFKGHKAVEMIWSQE